MDRIKEMLDQLSELDAEKLVELQSAIVGEFETVEKEDPTPQTVDAMTSLADMLDTVRGEISRREAQAQELAARAAEAAMRVKGEAEEMKEEMPEGEAPVEEEKEMPEEVPAPAMEEKEEDKPMAEASTAVEEASELSTAQETPATDVAATEVTPAAEASVAEETPAEAAAEVTPQAELSAESTETVEAPVAVEAPAVEAVAASADVAEVSETVETTQVAQTEQKEQEAPVTAAANETEATVTEVIEAPADRRPSLQTSAATVAITAGADIPGYTAGSTINNMSEVAEAMSKRLHALRRVNGGDGEQHIVASITTQYPEERTLSTDAESNLSLIHI